VNIFIIYDSLQGWMFASKPLPFKINTINSVEIFSESPRLLFALIHNCEGIDIVIFQRRLKFDERMKIVETVCSCDRAS